jgi:integrase/recombinase XerD
MTTSRKCLPIAAWPQIDRDLWQRGTESRRRLLDNSVAATWRPRTIATVAEAYGYALAWLQRGNLLDPTIAPELRWSYERVGAYAQDLLMRVRPATVKNRVLSLERALAVLAPKSDRSALRTVIRCLEVPSDHGRKRNRLQDPELLVTLGVDLMTKAEQGWRPSPRKNAAHFRDGLQISLLALRGFRKGNFTNIRIGTHLLQRNSRWWLAFSGDETKNHKPLEVPFPEMLLPQLHRYLENFRPLLAGDRYKADRLWLSYRYQPLAAHSLQLQLVHHTRMAFGRPINPHLFRDCIATSIAIHDPKHVRMAATILGHNSFATTERHYNLARTLEAGRSYSEAVTARRAAMNSQRRRSRA